MLLGLDPDDSSANSVTNQDSFRVVAWRWQKLLYGGGLTNNMARKHHGKSQHGEWNLKPDQERAHSEFDETRDENRFEKYRSIFGLEQPQPGSGESVHCRGEDVDEWRELESLY